MAGINHIRRWVMSQMTKKSDDGIMITLPDSKKVDLNLNITMDRLLRNGFDPDAFTNPQQVDNAVNMINSRMVSRAIPADSAEGREITEKIFGKQKAPVFDLEGNRIPEGSGIMGGKSVKNLMETGQVTKGARGMKKSKKVQDREMFQAANERLTSDVNSIIKNIKSMEPMDAMKEANSVIGRKGKYKNLSPEESKKILQDTEDHIFERDIPEEDFATGGRAGYKSGTDLLDMAKQSLGYTPEHVAAIDEMDKNFSGSQFDYSAAATKDMVDRASNPLTAITSAAVNVGARPFYDIADAIGEYSKKGYQGEFSFTPQGAKDFFGNLGSLGKEFIDQKPGIMAAGALKGGIQSLGTKLGEGIYNTFNPEPEPEEDYDFSGIEGQTAGLGVLTGLNKIFGPKIGAAIFRAGKNKTNSYIGKNIVKPGIDKAIKKIKDRKITTKSTGGGGPNIISGGGGDRDFSVKGPDTSANPTGKSNQASAARGYALHGADGGRAAFMAGGMGRRGFLKLLGLTGAGIAGAKTGLMGLGKQPAKQVAKEVVQQSASTPPPYFFKLAEKIKKLGSDTTPTNDRTIAKSLKSKDGKSDYILEEDVTTGDTIIKKVNKEGDEMITDVEIMEFRKGEVVKGKDGKAMKTPDQYEEVTEANARIEGDVFNDPYYSDGIEIDDILREVDDIPVPKASGGIARMLGE